MTLLAVERIKLTSTRAPWFCAALALVLTAGFATLYATKTSARMPATVEASQLGKQFGLVVVMVLAALAVTTEYRTGTIRTTFQAVPNRTKVFLAKTGTAALVAGIIGEICAFASYGMAALAAASSDLSMTHAADWRIVAGNGLVYALGAVIAVAVGILLRHTAGAIGLLLIWVLLAENMVQLIPSIGNDVHRWMPFNVGMRFLETGGQDAALGPWASLLYFAAVAAALLLIALGVAKRRDA